VNLMSKIEAFDTRLAQLTRKLTEKVDLSLNYQQSLASYPNQSTEVSVGVYGSYKIEMPLRVILGFLQAEIEPLKEEKAALEANQVEILNVINKLL
jgi:hypothetical protein